MGSGMSFVMTDIGASLGIKDGMVPGIVIGVIGMLMAIINYLIYKKMLDSRRKKYADKVIALSNEKIRNLSKSFRRMYAPGSFAKSLKEDKNVNKILT